MITIKNSNPESVRQSARHILYVEGAESDAFDPLVLSELLKNRVSVVSLGPAYHVGSVAAALYKNHPDSYFLIDRDHHSDYNVELSWQNFPDSNCSNLLIWRKREIENYFLNPDYLRKSPYCRNKKDEPEKTILFHASERLFLDSANHVIISIREEHKKNWIGLFSNPTEFKTKEEAINRLTSESSLLSRIENISNSLGQNRLIALFNEAVETFSGGQFPLKFGKGCWNERLRGRKILPSVIASCFKVDDGRGKELQGKEKAHEVIKSLLRLPLSEQPEDFQQLHSLIMKRVAMS